MDGSYHVATIHVVVRYGLSNDEQVSLKQNICKLMDDFDIDHVTIEVEFDTENCQKCD